MADAAATKAGGLSWHGLKDRWRATRRDTSRAGFDAAVKAALEAVEPYRWASLAEAADQFVLTLGERLNVHDVGVRFVAVHEATGRRRVIYWAGRHEGRADIALQVEPAEPRS